MEHEHNPTTTILEERLIYRIDCSCGAAPVNLRLCLECKKRPASDGEVVCRKCERP